MFNNFWIMHFLHPYRQQANSTPDTIVFLTVSTVSHPESRPISRIILYISVRSCFSPPARLKMIFQTRSSPLCLSSSVFLSFSLARFLSGQLLGSWLFSELSDSLLLPLNKMPTPDGVVIVPLTILLPTSAGILYTL